MNNVVQILLSQDEVNVLNEVIPQGKIIKIVKGDPTWGITGCPEQYHVAYINNDNNYFSPSMMFQLGGMLRQRLINNK